MRVRRFEEVMGWEEIIEYGRRGDHRQGNGLWYVIIG